MCFRIKLGSFFAGVVEAHDCAGAHSDHENDDNVEKLAQEAACSVGRTAPLHAQTIETDHAVKFCNDEEQEDDPQPGVINLKTAAIRADSARVHEHRKQMRENKSCKDHTGDELNPPHCGVSVTEQLVVAAHNAEGFVVARELTKSQNGVNDNEDENESYEYNVHPEVVNTVNEVAAGERNQRPEGVFAQQDGAGESHVAEQEQTKDKP